MGDKSKIEWTDATWNPIRGCTRVSKSCEHCYAERVAHRNPHYKNLTRMTQHGPIWTGDIRLVPELLDQPLRWKRPRRIFVNNMSDLFHERVPFDFIHKIFVVMGKSPYHIFQILTKRPERMKAFFDWLQPDPARMEPRLLEICAMRRWPLLTVCLGVSVEDQKTVEERIPALLQIPAAVRWISIEPLLASINLRRFFAHSVHCAKSHPMGDPVCRCSRISWVVVGGESGPGTRPMHPDWARSIRDQCQAARVSFFFKQWGE